MFSVLAKNIKTALSNGQRRRTMLVVMVAIKPILDRADET
jgi:energy-coupling factor transporter ATP-binding protein EcfA2